MKLSISEGYKNLRLMQQSSYFFMRAQRWLTFLSVFVGWRKKVQGKRKRKKGIKVGSIRKYIFFIFLHKDVNLIIKSKPSWFYLKPIYTKDCTPKGYYFGNSGFWINDYISSKTILHSQCKKTELIANVKKIYILPIHEKMGPFSLNNSSPGESGRISPNSELLRIYILFL